MSRTDKTRPFWVRVGDPYNRRYVEEDHDHRDGVCDFDGTSDWAGRWSSARKMSLAEWRAGQYRCKIEPKLSYAGFGEFMASTCGSWCVICDPAMLQNGCERMRLRAMVRNLLKIHPYFIEDDETWTTNARYLKRVRGEHWN